MLRLGPYASAGIRLVALSDSGDPNDAVLFEHNPDSSLNPASNMKLLTSIAALGKLGPEYRFRTRVLARGDIRHGTLRGDLVLQGGGDPILETPGLERLAETLLAHGLKRVDGNLIADDSRFDQERLGSGWNAGDEPFYYSAQVSALSVNRNVLTLGISPGSAVGASARVTVLPVEGYVRLLEVPRTGPPAVPGQELDLRVRRDRGRNDVRLDGTIPQDAAPTTREVTVEEPQLYAATLFKQLLASKGIRVRGAVSAGTATPDARELAAEASPPLAAILPLLNKPSDNLVAEILLKEIGRASTGVGSSAAGATAARAWLRERNIDTGGVRQVDGSGLSRMDLLTPRAVTGMLVAAWRQPWRDAFLASLPVMGVDGTLRNRLRGSAAERVVQAKTGTLNAVSALGGYAHTRSGKTLVFSILINNYLAQPSAKRIEDAIALAIVEAG